MSFMVKSFLTKVLLKTNRWFLFLILNPLNKHNILLAFKDDWSDNIRMAQKKLQHHQQLLDKGVELFMAKGYHGTGLKEILEAVNIPKGSFYHYYPSKEAFAAEVTLHYIRPFILQLQQHLQENPNNALASLQSYFDSLIKALAANDFQNGCLLGNFMGEMGDSSDLCRKALAEAVADYRDCLQQGLLIAQQQGTVRQDLNTVVMADLLVNLWQGALLRMKIERSIQPLEECCQYLLGDYFRDNHLFVGEALATTEHETKPHPY